MVKIEQEILSKIDIDPNTASKLAKDYYEIIKELLTALLLSNGLKSSNHECLISFFKAKYAKFEYETKIIHELKNIRNRVSYDGYFIDEDYINKNKSKFESVIALLEDLIEKNVPNMGRLD